MVLPVPDQQDRRDHRLPPRAMLSDEVYDQIKTMILDYEIQPEARISIDALVRRFGVSQTPIREAMARLESEDLVVKESMRGYSATALITRPELEDLFELRLLLEPWGAAKAAELVTDQLRESLETELGTLSDVPEETGYEGYKAVAAHDVRLHALVLEAAGNAAIRLAFERTHCHLHLFRLHYGRSAGIATLVEHRRIADAISSGDAKAAETAMTEHLHESRARIRRTLA